MKIGIYDPYLDDIGGGEKYMMTIASYLSKNHEVSVFWDHKSDLDDISSRFDLDLNKVFLYKNIFSLEMPVLGRIRETANFDILIILSDGSIPLTLAKKLFLHIQQPLKHIQNSSFMDKLKLARVNNIFVNSYFTKSFIEKTVNKKITVIYPPVEFYPQKLNKENIILHAGRFRAANIGNSDYKKQNFMINTFKKMVDSGLKNWKFILTVGVLEKDRKLFETMKKKAKNYPIIFYENATHETLWKLYSKAKIYWHASGYGEDLDKNPEYAEHFGITTVEAMSAGCVPVVINAGGQTEIVSEGKNGLLWTREEEFIEKTEKLIKGPKLLNKLSLGAEIRSKDFDINKFEENINRLIFK